MKYEVTSLKGCVGYVQDLYEYAIVDDDGSQCLVAGCKKEDVQKICDMLNNTSEEFIKNYKRPTMAELFPLAKEDCQCDECSYDKRMMKHYDTFYKSGGSPPIHGLNDERKMHKVTVTEMYKSKRIKL